jgi:hypothetical protein
MARELARHLEDRELVRPRCEAAEAVEVVDPGQDVHGRVVGALLRDVVELWADQGRKLRPTTMEFVQRGASKDVVETGDRLLVAGMFRM